MIIYISNRIKWLYQRLTRGWDDREIWSLDHTFAEWVVPRLELLKKVKRGIPRSMFLTIKGKYRPYTEKEEKYAEKKWNKILDDMIIGFKDKSNDCFEFRNKYHRYDRAKKLFCEHLDSLWD